MNEMRNLPRRICSRSVTDEVVVVLALLCAAILNPPLVAKIVL